MPSMPEDVGQSYARARLTWSVPLASSARQPRRLTLLCCRQPTTCRMGCGAQKKPAPEDAGRYQRAGIAMITVSDR
jgi:hypothetical protein